MAPNGQLQPMPATRLLRPEAPVCLPCMILKTKRRRYISVGFDLDDVVARVVEIQFCLFFARSLE